MAQKTKSHGIAVSTLFSAMSLLFGTAAYGSFYPGHIDPGGNGINIPGFTGDVIVNIDPGCVPGGTFTGWQPTNANGGSGCGNASLYSATIDLYSVAEDDPPNPGVVLGQFTLGPGWLILGVYTENGALAGIDTDAMGPAPGQPVGSHIDWVGHSFWLQFISDHCLFGCTAPGNFGGGIGFDPATISADDINNFGPFGRVTWGPACNTDASGAPIDCVVAQVPEPGTLGLILGALGGGWLARRRKEKAAA